MNPATAGKAVRLTKRAATNYRVGVLRTAAAGSRPAAAGSRPAAEGSRLHDVITQGVLHCSCERAVTSMLASSCHSHQSMSVATYNSAFASSVTGCLSDTMVVLHSTESRQLSTTQRAHLDTAAEGSLAAAGILVRGSLYPRYLQMPHSQT
jgi:hypothetical protein